MSGYRKDLAESYVTVADDRRLTVFPLLLDAMRPFAAGKRLLDYGGGAGEFAMLCAELPFERIVTYDVSDSMTALAMQHCAGEPRVEAVRSTRALESGAFDFVTSNGVWMCWPSEEDCHGNLQEIARLLAPAGTFFASVTHPCFRDQAFATYRTDFDLARYLEDGTRFRVTMFDGTRHVELEDTHWSLGAMARQLATAGFRIAGITEVADRGGAPGSPWMIVEARRS